jgi:hypothetical protein
MYISVHFSTKANGFTDSHKAALVNLLCAHKDITLVHAFASREFLNNKGINTEVLDFLDAFFPKQVSFFDDVNGVPLRDQMLSFVQTKKGLPVIICTDESNLESGVDEELHIIQSLGLTYEVASLDEYTSLQSVFFV